MLRILVGIETNPHWEPLDFFFQAEDGIRAHCVTGVQTCALPICRMTTDGRSTSWALPHRRANPTRIAAGPDGALWFTERDAHAIGRITTSGAITEFPLTTGLSPYDIEAGPDGALWFTADSCIGRITSSGAVSAWPVHRAGRLPGIVAAPDGTVWAAD